MPAYTENCFICASQLVYFEFAKEINCSLCGVQHKTNATCQAGHYVCDACHSEKGVLSITRSANETRSQNPVAIAAEMMKNTNINMHGPEHHYLVAAALLAAYKNAGGKIDLNKSLQKAAQRAKNVPGGICGMWGSCGAGIATGIFISVVTNATPLSKKEWSLANLMTSKCLAIIAENGGPRCCKRNTYLAVCQSAAFVKEQFAVDMELPEHIICEFSHRNSQCKGNSCLFKSPERKAGKLQPDKNIKN